MNLNRFTPTQYQGDCISGKIRDREIRRGLGKRVAPWTEVVGGKLIWHRGNDDGKVIAKTWNEAERIITDIIEGFIDDIA